MPLILASASKQREILLARLGVIPDNFFTPAIDETAFAGEMPRKLAVRLARAKAEKTYQKFPQSHILAGDIVIACGRRILDKPKNADEAQKHLSLLSGRAHRAYSALCLIAPDGRVSERLNISRIIMKRLSKSEFESYIASKEWQGCAGGYHIYGMAESFIKSIHGSPSGIAGLPLYEARQLLHGAGLL